MENGSFVNPYYQNIPEPIQPAPLNNKFLEAGREGKNEWWRYLVGILLSFVAGYGLIGAVPLLAIVIRGVLKGYFTLEDAQQNQANLENAEFLHVDKNVLLACILFIFVAGMFFLWIAVKYVHKKRFMSIIASERKPFSYSRYFTAFIIYITLSAISLAISYFSNPSEFQVVFEPLPFLGSLIICLILLPIQTGWEELFLRGYLLQGLGLWLKKPLVPLFITSITFGLLHMANAEVAANGVAEMLPQYILPGLIFGAIALLDERLELAMGLHLANNLFSILTVTSPEMTIQANSIWRVPSMGGAENMILGTLPLLIVIPILWKIYNWNITKLYR
jgi:membrane protease YdiL (CAAX protease family)